MQRAKKQDCRSIRMRKRRPQKTAASAGPGGPRPENGAASGPRPEPECGTAAAPSPLGRCLAVPAGFVTFRQRRMHTVLRGTSGKAFGAFPKRGCFPSISSSNRTDGALFLAAPAPVLRPFGAPPASCRFGSAASISAPRGAIPGIFFRQNGFNRRPNAPYFP